VRNTRAASALKLAGENPAVSNHLFIVGLAIINMPHKLVNICAMSPLSSPCEACPCGAMMSQPAVNSGTMTASTKLCGQLIAVHVVA